MRQKDNYRVRFHFVLTKFEDIVDITDDLEMDDFDLDLPSLEPLQKSQS